MKSLSLRNSCQLFSHHPCRAREEWQPGWQRQERNWNTDPGQCCSSHWIYMYYPHIKGAVTFFLTKNISYSFLKPCSYFIPHRQKSLKLAVMPPGAPLLPQRQHRAQALSFPEEKRMLWGLRFDPLHIAAIYSQASPLSSLLQVILRYLDVSFRM